MTQTDQLEAVEQRAFDARLTMQEVCERAGVAQSTWSRAKARGSIRVKTLRRIEAAVASAESENAAP